MMYYVKLLCLSKVLRKSKHYQSFLWAVAHSILCVISYVPYFFNLKHVFLVNGGVKPWGLTRCGLVDKSRLGQTGGAEVWKKICP